MVKKPRDYQTWAHQALWNFIHDSRNFADPLKGTPPRNPLVVEATGLGKSLNIAMFIWHILSVYPKTRIMQLSHVKELVAGNYGELLGMWPSAPAGIYAAGLNVKETRSQVTFAMINSVAKRAATFGHIDFLIIDEAHRLSDVGATMYSKFIADLRRKNPNLVVIGYTATPFRMGLGHLIDGKLFDEVVYDIGSGESFLWAVNEGYLIMPVPVDPGFKVDDSSIGITSGDFTTSDASKALHDQDIIERAVDYSIVVATEQSRRSALTFAQSIDDAELIAEMFTYKGFPCEAVHSKRGDRDEVLEAHRKGDLWGIVNKDILTTGYNDPMLDLMVVLRLTRSPGLWVQMVGRMTRPVWLPGYDISTKEGRWESILASHKQTALVLDFVGNTERLGPINYPNLPARRGAGGGEPPVRTCSVEKGGGCSPSTYHHVSVKVCPYCGYEWPVETHLNDKASNAQLVTPTNPLGLPAVEIKKEFEIISVHEMTATKHEGKVLRRDDDGNVLEKKLDTVKVVYRSGFASYNQWVCFAHPSNSFPRKQAEKWWNQHGGDGFPPSNIDEAVEQIGGLNKPKFLKVWINTKYPEIVAYDFEGTKFELNLNPDKKIYEPEPDPMAKIIEDANKSKAYVNNAFAGYDFDDDIPF